MEYEPRRQEILREISSITRMERGKLSAQSPGPDKPPFYKLQCWHQGKNQTRYVPAAEVASVQAASFGAGVRTGVDLPGGYQGLTANFEVARQFSDLPTLAHGWRENVSINMRF